MFGKDARSRRQLKQARLFFEYLRGRLNSPISVRLWDGSVIQLADNVEPGLEIMISGPDVIGTLLRRPTAETLLRVFARGGINYSGTDLVTFIEKARVRDSRRKTRGLPLGLLARFASAFVFEKGERTTSDHSYSGDETGHSRQQQDNKDFIQFHYDVSNQFYRLFLDKQLVYSCGYFRDWNESLEQAQVNKLDMICRKLQLQNGDRFLDIGCGWGALICHATKYYGVRSHGITLSRQQLALAQQRLRTEGLADRATVELKDYADVEGQFDKIASIGMVEHVGIDNMAGYMQKVNSLLPDRGMFLNHGITRPGKMTDKAFRRVSPERRLLAKYIFPGGELDHLGHMIQATEANGFDVHDVEGWRDHYSLTCRHWCQRLEAHRDMAIQEVGPEKYRLWVLYLAGCVYALGDGGARIYQTVATKHQAKGLSGMPCTREHLYAESSTVQQNSRVA
ncbi:MAG: cyclopropane-fatty-acyl-phospholipid synthase family protein [Fuerstiella sp.]|nr:cyclopropane-fatty-acyl-phospholipid synthase family protein [Fuerstiella sp.]